MTQAVAYLRTSSMTNVGPEKDSDKRQRDAIEAFARHSGIDIVREFYDAGVSGTDTVMERPEFASMIEYCEATSVTTILVESPDRFARDLMVQLAGHEMLKKAGFVIVPVSSPTFFTDPSPTADLVRSILGAVYQFERDTLVRRLKVARDRKRAETGRCGGPQPVPADHVDYATRFWQTGMSLREISESLACNGRLNANGKPYSASSIKNMLSASTYLSPPEGGKP